MKKKNPLLKLSACAAIIGGTIAFGQYIYKVSSKPHEHNGANDFDPLITRGREFIRNHPDRSDVLIESFDELMLHASFIPSKENSHDYVILVHGIWDNHESNGIYAKHYLEKGFGCLLPDNRGFGMSQGAYIGYGLDDSLDILQWINWLIEKDPDARIILHGMSMGAATVLMCSGARLPENVKGIIADSAYTTLREQFAASYRIVTGTWVPIPIALAISRIIIRIRSGFDINDVSPIDAVKKSVTPILFMHGDNDTFIDPHMCSRLYEAATCPRQYCMILGAGHIAGVVVDPDNYWSKVDSFCAKYLK